MTCPTLSDFSCSNNAAGKVSYVLLAYCYLTSNFESQIGGLFGSIWAKFYIEGPAMPAKSLNC